MENLGDGLVWYAVFLFSTVFHEAAHAWTALRMGDDTAYEGGQVSLNPIPHIQREPFGTVLVPILTFFSMGWMMGWASTPYNFGWALTYPRRQGWMSLAGPISNLILALAAALLIKVGLAAGVFHAPEAIRYSTVVASHDPGLFSTAALFLSVFFSLNLLLFVFNLLPLPPLDGSGAVTLMIPETTSRRYLEFIHRPGFQLISFLIAWQVFKYIFSPVHLAAINLLYPGMGYH